MRRRGVERTARTIPVALCAALLVVAAEARPAPVTGTASPSKPPTDATQAYTAGQLDRDMRAAHEKNMVHHR